eukprot:3702515-Alexandrium_andersonii.AAC.1
MEDCEFHAMGACDASMREHTVYGKAWGFTSAFDRVDPAVARQIWLHLGVPKHVALSMTHVWMHQE